MTAAAGNAREGAAPADPSSPLPACPIPTRPALRKVDVLCLIRLVICYRSSWEIWIDEPDGIWAAQGATCWNRGCRYEADTAEHLEQMIRFI